MHKEVSIWDKGIYGLVFDGREAEPKAPVRYISERNKLVLIERPKQMGGEGQAKRFSLSKVSM